MKTMTSKLLTLMLFLPTLLLAQDGYTYTLVDNGGYNYSVMAAPNTSTSNFPTAVQSYGFTILIPDGVTLSVNASLGNAASSTHFDGGAVAPIDPTMATKDGYLITETLGSPVSLPAPSSGTMTSLVTVQLDSSPTSGEISILANNSVLASDPTVGGSFQSYEQADMTDDAMVNYTDVIDNVGSSGTGLSGTTSFSFNTLSIAKNVLTGVSLYPNPTNGNVSIKGVNNLESVEVMNVNGQRVLNFNGHLETLNVNDLNSGVYFVKLSTAIASKTIKLIKK